MFLMKLSPWMFFSITSILKKHIDDCSSMKLEVAYYLKTAMVSCWRFVMEAKSQCPQEGLNCTFLTYRVVTLPTRLYHLIRTVGSEYPNLLLEDRSS